MKKSIFAVLLSTVVIPVAHAADMSAPAYKAPLYAPALVPLWTGFYIGGNIGYGWGHASIDGLNGSMDPNGINGGVQLGYNWQVNSVVFGLEGDFQGANHRDSLTLSAPLIPATATLEVKSDWFATLRGRIGYAFGPFMPYVTGGVAFTQTKASLDASAPGAFVNVSTDKTTTGYAVGGGIEYTIGRNWSVKAEYLYLGFGTQTYDFNLTAGVPALGIAAAGTFQADAKVHYDIARVGVNYRF
jgi:outer membrane immunogenic protein